VGVLDRILEALAREADGERLSSIRQWCAPISYGWARKANDGKALYRKCVADQRS